MKRALEVSSEDARDIIYSCHNKFKVIKDEIIDTTRWSIVHNAIVQNIETDKYYSTVYSVGATEQQDEQPYEYDSPVFIEVKPVEKVIKDWEEVDASSNKKPLTMKELLQLIVDKGIVWVAQNPYDSIYLLEYEDDNLQQELYDTHSDFFHLLHILTECLDDISFELKLLKEQYKDK